MKKTLIALLTLVSASTFAQLGAEIGYANKHYIRSTFSSNNFLNGGTISIRLGDPGDHLNIKMPITILANGETTSSSIGIVASLVNDSIFAAYLGAAVEYMDSDDNSEVVRELKKTTSFLIKTELEAHFGKNVSVSTYFDLDATNFSRRNKNNINNFSEENAKVSKSGVGLTIRVRLNK